jgi:hypothetical protein
VEGWFRQLVQHGTSAFINRLCDATAVTIRLSRTDFWTTEHRDGTSYGSISGTRGSLPLKHWLTTNEVFFKHIKKALFSIQVRSKLTLSA